MILASIEPHKKALDKLSTLMLKTLKLKQESSQKLQKEVFAMVLKMSPFIEEVNTLARNPEFLLPGELPEEKVDAPKFNDMPELQFDKKDPKKDRRIPGAIYLEEVYPILISKLKDGTLYGTLETLGNSQYAIEKCALKEFPTKKQLMEYNASRNFISTLEKQRKKKGCYLVDYVSLRKDSVKPAPRLFAFKKEDDSELMNMAISHGFNEDNDPQLCIQSKSGFYFCKALTPSPENPEKGKVPTVPVADDEWLKLSPLNDKPSFALHKDLLFVFQADMDRDGFYKIVVYKLKPGSNPTEVPQEPRSEFRFKDYKSFILREKESRDKNVHIHLFMELSDTEIHHSVYGTDGKIIGADGIVNVAKDNDQRYKIKGMSYNLEKDVLCVLVNSKAKKGVKVIQYVLDVDKFSPPTVEKLKITMQADFNDLPITFFSADLNTPSNEIILFLCSEDKSYSFVSKGGENTSTTKRGFRFFSLETNLALKSMDFNPSDKSLVLLIEPKQEVDDDSDEPQMNMNSSLSQSKAPTSPQQYFVTLKVDLKVIR